MISNPVAQIVQMYNLIEAHLRRAATTDKPMLPPQLLKQADIAACSKNPWQVRDLLKSLQKKGFVIHDYRGYVWNLKAPPFVVSNRSIQNARIMPSEATVTHVKKPRVPSIRETHGINRRVAPPKDIELVIGGTLIVIGRNEKTNRLRIVIEDVGE